MKGINIFIVLLILVFFISSVSADTTNGSIETYIVSSDDHTENVYGNSGSILGDFLFSLNHDTGGIPDSYYIDNVDLYNDSANPYGSIPGNLGDPFVIYWSTNGISKDLEVGYGSILVGKKSYEGSHIVRASLTFYFDNFTKKSGVSGKQYYILDGSLTAIYDCYGSFCKDGYASYYADYYDNLNSVITFQEAGGCVPSFKTGTNSIKHEYNSAGSFRNDYEIEYTETYVDIDIQRQGFDTTYDLNSSHIKMVNTTDSVTHYESSDTTSNSSHFLIGGDYNYYIVRQIDDYEHLIFTFEVPVVESEGTIELNQTSYTDPELIQMDITLTTYDFTDYSYYIITEVREDDSSWDNVAGSYNGTTKISTASESRTLDIDTWPYILPLWVRVKLMEYEKTTGEYSTIYTTGMVRYNPSIPDGIKFGGTVIDADTNQIISGALVSVDGVTTASDTTNAWGEFLMYLYPGLYTVTTSKTGYQTSTSEDLLMEFDNTWAQIYLTPVGYGNGTLYGNVNDANTGYAIQDVHVIISNATDSISAYTSSGGYYEGTGLAQSSTYNIRALKSGYYTYNGSVTTEASGATHKSFEMVQINYSVTPTPTTVSTYPGGEGHEWSNDEIMTMLRVIVPGFFMLMLIFLFLAVIMGVTGNNGNGGQRGLGLNEIWKR